MSNKIVTQISLRFIYVSVKMNSGREVLPIIISGYTNYLVIRLLVFHIDGLSVITKLLPPHTLILLHCLLIVIVQYTLDAFLADKDWVYGRKLIAIELEKTRTLA